MFCKLVLAHELILERGAKFVAEWSKEDTLDATSAESIETTWYNFVVSMVISRTANCASACANHVSTSLVHKDGSFSDIVFVDIFVIPKRQSHQCGASQQQQFTGSVISRILLRI